MAGKGHNGGFNPYRDQNGEFADPSGAGKPGRSRKGGAAASSAASSGPSVRSFTDGKLSRDGYTVGPGRVGGTKVSGGAHAQHIGQQILAARGQPRSVSKGELVDRLVDLAANDRGSRRDLLPVLRSLDTNAAVTVERMK